MTAELQYFAKVNLETGEWEGLPKRKFRQEVARVFGGCSIEIVIHRKKKHRSIQQNRYYWLIVTMMADHTGFTKDEMHGVLRCRFLKAEKVNESSGLVYEYTKSTTELSTVEYEEYLEQVRNFGIEEFDMRIPMPNEQIVVF